MSVTPLSPHSLISPPSSSPPLLLSPGQAKAHCRVGVATLNTLAGYIDWVALANITNDNCHLLEMLCLLLSETELQLEAAECLLIAISRKVSTDYTVLDIPLSAIRPCRTGHAPFCQDTPPFCSDTPSFCRLLCRTGPDIFSRHWNE